jgi:hypothetical protein
MPSEHAWGGLLLTKVWRDMVARKLAAGSGHGKTAGWKLCEDFGFLALQLWSVQDLRSLVVDYPYVECE